jgi:membrane dipeptidase
MFILDLNTPTRLLVIADLLHGRGYSDSRIEKIIGGNGARLLQDVWE